jgi:hypothetical protein
VVGTIDASHRFVEGSDRKGVGEGCDLGDIASLTVGAMRCFILLRRCGKYSELPPRVGIRDTGANGLSRGVDDTA